MVSRIDATERGIAAGYGTDAFKFIEDAFCSTQLTISWSFVQEEAAWQTGAYRGVPWRQHYGAFAWAFEVN